MAERSKNIRRRLFSESEVNKVYFKDIVEQHPVKDISFDLFYQPRTITLLFLIISGLTYFAFTRSYDNAFEDDLFTGAMVTLVVFLIISTMIMPNGPFVRPHPLVWRVVFGASLVYFLIMVCVLFLRLEDARKIMFYFDPKLVKMRHCDILSKEYAVNCSEVTFARVWSHMDVFAYGHFVGWLIKAVLLRHYGILWLLSINWEITEIAFMHILPNFAECWWDSILLDVVFCNGLGIYCGMVLCQWFHVRSYDWESVRDIPSTRGKLKRAVLQFTPISWTPTRWLDSTSTIKRAFQVSLLVIIWQVAELNLFFLKHIFIVKPGHFLTQLRVAIITLSSAPAIRQFYYYVSDNQVKRIGSQMWIFVSTLLVETLVSFRLGNEVFEKTILWNVLYWLIYLVFSSFLTVFLCLYISKWQNRSVAKTKIEAIKEELISDPKSSSGRPEKQTDLRRTPLDESPLRRRTTRATANDPDIKDN